MEMHTPMAGISEPPREGNADAPMKADTAESSNLDVPTNSASKDKADDSLRNKIRALCEKIGAGELQMALAFVQTMDATAIHAMLPMLTQLLAAAQPTELPVLQMMQQMEPESLKALVMEELRNQVDKKASGAPASEGAQGSVPPQNPLEAMLGTFLAGKGMGKGFDACNPAFTPTANSWDTQGNAQQNPFQQLISAALAGKGKGKGNDSCPTTSATGLNPLDVLGMLVGKGAGKGYMSEPAPPATASCPEGTPPAPTTLASPASDADPAARSVFEESVDDLLSMGLVSDRQVARELLTTHGDISTVVAVLTAE
jgi:hypothetical protein